MLASVDALIDVAGLITPPLVKGGAYEAHPPSVVDGGDPGGGYVSRRRGPGGLRHSDDYQRLYYSL